MTLRFRAWTALRRSSFGTATDAATGRLGEAGPLNLTDVVNLVELVQIAVRLKHERFALPGEMLAVQPQTGLRFESEYLGSWIVQQLGWEE